MPQSITLIQNNFISGEVSPLLEGRIDSPRYQTGLRECENFIPMRQGLLRKRNGTMYRGATRSNLWARVEFMVGTDGAKYVIEFTDLKARVWAVATHTLVGAPVEITTPWTAAQLPDMRVCAIKGYLWCVHKGYAPRRIFLSGIWQIDTPTITATGLRTNMFTSSGNYPGAIAYHQGRLVLAGTTNEPNGIWLSAAIDPTSTTDANLQDFILGTGEDDAIALYDSDVNGTAITWLTALHRLIAATDTTLWIDNGSVATPTGYDGAINTYSGAAGIQAQLANTNIVYIGRGGTSLHALLYVSNGDYPGFQDIDLSQDANHILASGTLSMAVMMKPEPIVWIITGDHELVSCTLDFQNGVIAWSRHPMAGSALPETLTVVPGADGDELWIVVSHPSGDETVETLSFQDITTTVQEDFHYVDSGLALEPTSETISGLDHLEGQTVAIWGDGAVLPTQVVSSGEITVDKTYVKMHVGLPVESRVETLRPETPANGTSQGKQKAIQNVKLRLYRSMGGEVSSRLSTTTTPLLYWIGGTYVWGDVLELYTDTKAVELGATLDPDATVIIGHDDPAPFNILALIYKVAIMEV